MNALSELQNRISCLVLTNSSLDDFGEWFVDRLWDVEQSGDDETRAAFYMVEGILAEASHANWEDVVLRDELAAASQQPERSLHRVPEAS